MTEGVKVFFLSGSKRYEDERWWHHAERLPEGWYYWKGGLRGPFETQEASEADSKDFV